MLAAVLGRFRLRTSVLQFFSNAAIYVGGFVELPLLDILALGMRDLNRSRTNQQRLAPVRELGNVRGKGSDHRGQSVDRSQSKKGKFQRKRNLELVARSRQNLLPQFI